MKELTSILVTFSPDENQTLTPIFFFCFLGKFNSCFITSYSIQGGFREASGRLGRLKVYETISWFFIILDLLEQEVCKVFFAYRAANRLHFTTKIPKRASMSSGLTVLREQGEEPCNQLPSMQMQIKTTDAGHIQKAELNHCSSLEMWFNS